MSEILRKLTLKNCGLSVAVIKEHCTPESTSVELLRVVGITTSAKPGQTDKGEYLRLMGDFRAVSMLTGEAFTSAQCILPSFISETLGEALKTSPRVEFALSIGAKFDSSAVTGYVFTVHPLIEAAPSDQMAALMNTAGVSPGGTPKLAAKPATAPAPAMDAKPAAKKAA